MPNAATRDGGTPTTETMVSTLMMLFCSTLISPKVALEQQLDLIYEVGVVIAERHDILAQRVETLLIRAAAIGRT
jgi:hypothetical protein